MALKLFNTLSRKIETFKPLQASTVRMYTCGPTVYNFAHIGNFRSYVWEDLLRRYFKFKGYKVTQVMNLTDVDDKTIKGSRAEGVSLAEFTQKYKKAFFEDLAKLNVEKAEHYPAATDHIPEMVALIKKLLEKGFAYRGDDGTIYYSISKFKPYGKLSHFKIKKLIAGARVNQDEYEKKQLGDFALWKAWDENDGNVFWETELGKGRPGWHIECSAMSTKYLGESFDVHTGGIDNMFPHHENEIAQSEAATGKQFVKHWLHCKHLIVEGKKMSKSLGNFFTLHDLQQYNPLALRLVLLSTHYRKQLDFSIKTLGDAQKKIERLNEVIAKLTEIKENKTASKIAEKEAEKLLAGFEKAMDSDLNVPKAMAALFGFVKKANALFDKRALGKKDAEKMLAALSRIDSVFGVMNFKQKKEEALPAELRALVEKREELRKQKRFAEADAIRTQLREKGIELLDAPDGVKWKKTS